jgi:hypothetical protein
MTSYATADLDAIIKNLEASLAKGTAEVVFEGRKLVYRSVADIRNAIAYFTALYDNATDAPPNPKPKKRIFFLFGGKGIGFSWAISKT